jgi:predicted  nucleic acid-binding Zn-ribbon protein
MKILFAVSLLAIGAAAVLAFMTRGSLVETRNEKDSINRQIVGIHEAVLKVNAETDGVWQEWKTTTISARDEDTAAKKLVRETKDQEDILTKLKKDIQDIVDKRADMERQIAEATGEAGGTPEEIVAQVDALKGETDALSMELETLKKELEVHKKAATDSDNLSATLKAQQAARLKTIQLGGRSATITSVNPEFSFAIVNMGRKDGLTMDSRLLVKRGGVHVGNLNIVSIENSQTVADIDLRTLRPGMQIAPGDEVVIQNSVQ